LSGDRQSRILIQNTYADIRCVGVCVDVCVCVYVWACMYVCVHVWGVPEVVMGPLAHGDHVTT